MITDPLLLIGRHNDQSVYRRQHGNILLTYPDKITQTLSMVSLVITLFNSNIPEGDK